MIKSTFYDREPAPTHNLNDVILKYRYGEVVPLGPNYLPSYAAGVRAGIKELGPRLIDHDPTQLRVINAHMDYHLKGHPYVKSPLDMACWDILGKVGINFKRECT